MIWGRVFREFATRLVGLSLRKYASTMSSLDGERERKSYVHGLRQEAEGSRTCIFWKIYT